MVSMHSEKPICAPSCLSEVSSTFPLKWFQCSSAWWWPSLILLRKIIECFLFPCLSPPGDRWCDVLGFVPTGSVSSSSTLQILWEASHLWELLCQPVYLLSHFFPFTLACPGQHTHRRFWRWMFTIDTLLSRTVSHQWVPVLCYQLHLFSTHAVILICMDYTSEVNRKIILICQWH